MEDCVVATSNEYERFEKISRSGYIQQKVHLDVCRLYSLLKEEKKYEWAEECQRTFDEVKRILTTTPILVCPIWSMEFHIHCVVSNVAIGAVLAQNIHMKVDSPIYYANKLMNSAEKNYSTTEREALAMVYSVQIFCHYLQANHFIFYVDHQNLVVLDQPTNGVRMNC